MMSIAAIDDDVDYFNGYDGVSADFILDQKRISITTSKINKVTNAERRPGHSVGQETVRTPE